MHRILKSYLKWQKSTIKMVRQNVFGAFTTYITIIAQPILSTARDPMNQGSWIFRTTPDEVSARHFSYRKIPLV